MSYDLSLARSHALDLARIHMVSVVLFRSSNEFGVLPVAAPSPGDGMDEIIAAFDEHGESLPVARSRFFDEFCFHGSIPIAVHYPLRRPPRGNPWVDATIFS